MHSEKSHKSRDRRDGDEWRPVTRGGGEAGGEESFGGGGGVKGREGIHDENMEVAIFVLN